jgi:hypothetical protein
LSEYAADHRVGLFASLTRKARELLCLAGIGCGFETAVNRLKKFCGLRTSTQTMRRICEREGILIEQWREGIAEEPTPTIPEANPDSTCLVGDDSDNEALVGDPLPSTCDGEPAPPAPPDADPMRSPTKAAQEFRKAEGHVEFGTDGTSVNTLEGWRELRIALWLKRPSAPPAEPYQWSSRSLPKPTARAVLIDMACSDEFGARWRDWAGELGIKDPAQVTALADGAEWIWKQVGIQFPGAEGVLDIYHASEHVADVARAIFDREGAALGWTSVGIDWLLREGWNGICRWIAAVRDACNQSQPAIDQTENLIGYLSKHTQHLHYRQRLETGKSIGSGPLEGAAKQLVGRRLKQTGARWQPKNAIAMTTLVSAEWAGDWDLYWDTSPNQQDFPLLAV